MTGMVAPQINRVSAHTFLFLNPSFVSALQMLCTLSNSCTVTNLPHKTLQTSFQGDIGSFAFNAKLKCFQLMSLYWDLQKYIQLTRTSEPKVFDLFLIISSSS